MGFYVLLEKHSEDSQKAIYFFGPDETAFGELEIDKVSGETQETKPAAVSNPSAYFIRATVKIRQYWQRGEFPQRTCWAS